MDITTASEWSSLRQHCNEDIAPTRIADHFQYPSRFDDLTFSFDRLFVDFSKQKLTPETIRLLIALAQRADLSGAIKALTEGEEVNFTEKRAALHTALRLSPDKRIANISGEITAAIQQQLARMSTIIDAITSTSWRGFSGKPITDVVNLGVGGSDLGPLLACHALDEFKQRYPNPINVHFASTMDGSQVASLFKILNPETTLFVIVSKSFSTIDTLSNAQSARAWLLKHCADRAIVNKQHFIAVSTDEEKMSEWGIHPNHQLKFWEWVGGRFSLWSTVGLSIALKIGMDNFRKFLAGAESLDRHFATAAFAHNIPVLMGLVGIWNTNFLGISAHAILPYDARLKFFPAYLTQLEMESNGKSVHHSGKPVTYDTCPVLWGEIGPNAQHAFYQLLHQGTRKVTCDFIAPEKRFVHGRNEHDRSLHEQHLLTLANCLAQSRALMIGGSSGDAAIDRELIAHKHYPGDQPSTTILIDELTPYSLGQLIALYEHKVFVMATIWGINPFDQWGVELGKTMSKETLSALRATSPIEEFDGSTNGLANHLLRAFSQIEEDKK